MSVESVYILAAMIFVAALLYSSVGHAGASGYLAAMALMGIAPSVMRPTALGLNVCVALIATYQFHRAGFFSWRLFLPLAAASVPAAFVGGLVEDSGRHFRPLVGLVLLFAAARLLIPTREREVQSAPPSIPLCVFMGGALGLLAGLTGTGGGIFLSPLLLLLRWGDTKQVCGVSAAFILVNSIAGLAGLLSRWPTLPSGVFLWALAAVAGGIIGSYLGSRRLQTKAIRAALAGVLVIASAKLVLT